MAGQLNSFVQKFYSLWQAGNDARLNLECHAGKAQIHLQLNLHLQPQPQHQPRHHPPPPPQQPRRHLGPSHITWIRSSPPCTRFIVKGLGGGQPICRL